MRHYRSSVFHLVIELPPGYAHFWQAGQYAVPPSAVPISPLPWHVWQVVAAPPLGVAGSVLAFVIILFAPCHVLLHAVSLANLLMLIVR